MEQPSSEESNIPSPTHQFASFDEILNKTGGISQFSLPASYTKVNLPEIVSNGDQPCEERNCEESLPNINSLPPLFSGDVIPVDKQGNFISTLPPDPIFSLLIDPQENNKKNILETEMQELLDKKESNLNHFMLRNILKNISKDNVEEIEDSFLMKFISQISEKLKINITGQNMNLVNC